MTNNSTAICPELRAKIREITGSRFDDRKTLEELVLHLARVNTLLDTKNQYLTIRLKRTKKAYEFATLESKSWQQKAINTIRHLSL